MVETIVNITLILIHGSGAYGGRFETMKKNLCRMGIEVIAPDLRGHGRNPERRGDIDYLGQLDDDLRDLIRQLKNKNPSSRIILGGHSAGGAFVLKFAKNNHQLLSGVLLLAPYLGWAAPTTKQDRTDIRSNRKMIMLLEILTRFGITWFNGIKVIHFDRIPEQSPEAHTFSYSFRMLRDLMFGDSPSELKELARVNLPLLLLVGEEDQAFFPDKYSESVLPYQPNAEIFIIEGCDHSNLLDSVKAKNIIGEWILKTWRA